LVDSRDLEQPIWLFESFRLVAMAGKFLAVESKILLDLTARDHQEIAGSPILNIGHINPMSLRNIRNSI
jgi:hypothetical protein